MEGWESFDGMLALRGVDPSSWTLRRLLNAAEYQILTSASDEKERAKLHARLYAPLPRTAPTPGRVADGTARARRGGVWSTPVYSGVADSTGTVPGRAEGPPEPAAVPPAATGSVGEQSVASILAMAALQDG